MMVNLANPNTPRMVRWLIEHSDGYIQDEKQAVYALLLVCAIFFFMSYHLLATSTSKAKPLTQAQIQHIIQNQQNGNATQ